jgi:hypothetical protein
MSAVPTYHWAGEYAQRTASGVTATLPIASIPITNPADHSLTEIDAQSYNGHSMVEIGAVNVSYKSGPQLFVTWWKDGQLKSFNWYGNPHASHGTFSLKYTAGKWVAVYDGKVLERIPGSTWSDQFTHARAEQAFAETQGPVKFVTGTVSEFRTNTLIDHGTYYGPVVRVGAGSFRIN